MMAGTLMAGRYHDCMEGSRFAVLLCFMMFDGEKATEKGIFVSSPISWMEIRFPGLSCNQSLNDLLHAALNDP